MVPPESTGQTEPAHPPQPKTAEDVVVTLGVDGTQRPVEWTVSTTGSPHAFVLGIPGQGKSVTTRKILRDFATQRLPALVFDFHGDMAATAARGCKRP